MHTFAASPPAPGSAATAPTRELMLTTVTTATPPTGSLHLVVGYDGSPPASRALDAAVRLLQGRTGHIDVVYVAHLSSLAMLSPGAIAEMESDFDEIEQQLRAAAAEQLRGGLGVRAAPGHCPPGADRGGHSHRRCRPRQHRGDRGGEFVTRHPPGCRFGRCQPGPSLAGAAGHRPVASRPGFCGLTRPVNPSDRRACPQPSEHRPASRPARGMAARAGPARSRVLKCQGRGRPPCGDCVTPQGWLTAFGPRTASSST